MHLMTADTSSDVHVNALLQEDHLRVNSTGLISRQNTQLPGIGEAKEVLKDAFDSRGPIDPKLGGKPKKYFLAGRVLVAVVTETQKPDLNQLEGQKVTLVRELASRKVKAIQQEWLKKMNTLAKIDTNPSVIGNSDAGG
jgi:hypothetical protein